MIDAQGTVRSVDWSDNYNAMRRATNTLFPGYLIIEALEWDGFHRQWVCLPRRVSLDPYDEDADEKRGSNIMIRASEDFSAIQVMETGVLTPTRGFSSFKFLPGSRNQVILRHMFPALLIMLTMNSDYVSVLDNRRDQVRRRQSRRYTKFIHYSK